MMIVDDGDADDWWWLIIDDYADDDNQSLMNTEASLGRAESLGRSILFSPATKDLDAVIMVDLIIVSLVNY